jgi:lipoate---protein ligase
MIYQSEKKFKNEKIIRVKIEADRQINAIRITGDFFLYPEIAISGIEKRMAGLPIDITASEVIPIIREALAENKAAFMEISAEDVTEAICEALRDSVQST